MCVRHSGTVKRFGRERSRRCKTGLSVRASGRGGTRALNSGSAGGTIELVILARPLPRRGTPPARLFLNNEIILISR